MKALDLFAGAAGGWSLACHAAGIETVAACEIDPWRRAVYSHRWPAVRMYDDVATLSAARLANDGITGIDIIVGSSPCQDISSANPHGKGIDGERSGLFWEALRLVRELRPRWVCLENSPRLRTAGYDRLAERMEADGYAGWPLVVAAAHAGAPHLRKRVWWVAADRQAVQRASLARGEPDGIGTGAVADAAGERRGRQDGSIKAGWPGRQPAGPAHAQPERLRELESQGRVEAQRRRNRDVSGERAPSDASCDGRRQGWPGRPDTSDARQPVAERAFQDAADADGNGVRIEPGRGESGWPGQAKLAPWHRWNGGAPDLGRLDDGISEALAARRGIGRACLAAYGDAVVPQVAAAILRAILSADTTQQAAA